MKIITLIKTADRTPNKILCELSEEELYLMIFGVRSEYGFRDDDPRKKECETLEKALRDGKGNIEFSTFKEISRVIDLAKRQSEVAGMMRTLDRTKEELQALLDYQHGLEYFMKFGSEPLDI